MGASHCSQKWGALTVVLRSSKEPTGSSIMTERLVINPKTPSVRASQITWMLVYGCSELPTHRSPPQTQRPRSGTFNSLVHGTHGILRVKLSKAGYRGKVLCYFLFFPYPAFCFNLKNWLLLLKLHLSEQKCPQTQFQVVASWLPD